MMGFWDAVASAGTCYESYRKDFGAQNSAADCD